MTENNDNQQTIGERINFARESYEWNQTELSEMIEVTRAAVSQYEKDMIRPRAEIIDRLARVFNADPEWFTHGRGRGPKRVEAPVIIPEIDLALYTPHVTDLRHLRLGADIGLRKSWLDNYAGDTVTFVAPNAAGPVAEGDHVLVDLKRLGPGAGVFLVFEAKACRLCAADPALNDTRHYLGRVIAYFRTI